MSVSDSSSFDRKPCLASATAEHLARDQFGVAGRATELPSERDQNFHVVGDDGRCLVLKIANGADDRSLLEAQQAALRHLTDSDVIPRIVAARGGSALVVIDGSAGAVTDACFEGRSANEHLAWAIDWLPGRPLSSQRHRSTSLYQDLGRQTGMLSTALATFDHPAIHRDFHWDLANGRAVVDRNRALLGDTPLGAAIDRSVAEFDRVVAPLLSSLPRSAIHGDLNDNNILVDDGNEADDPETRGQRVTGIVDFGDMVHSYRVADLAIAIAYAMLGGGDPLAVTAAIVRGYSEQVQLDDNELRALFGLAVLRLCVSACMAAEQCRDQPENEYLGVSQSSIGIVLPKLVDIPLELAEIVVRRAAGVSASPVADRVREYIARTPVAPIFGAAFDVSRSIVVDLSVDSSLVDGDYRENAEPKLTERIFGAMRDANVPLAVGRYDEPRLLYVTPIFEPKERGGEWRTIHIGLDLFAEAGTPVYAPIAGVVHAFADNAFPLDYGPVIVLRHATDDGAEFFTLYGHLSRESLGGLNVGQELAAGDRIATLGAADVNGGWTPHLHLQVITDLLGFGTDFPGVALASQRRAWTTLCPDPNLLVRVPAERFPAWPPGKEETLAARRARVGGNLSIAYRDPVKIVRGWRQYLYDDSGRRFIDAYNNVPHVGHCHPRVVAAGAAQMRVLNTNTRYLHDRLADYAERLLSTLPAPLEVCYFVNSASEANELALRLARTFTGRRDTVVLEAAYHGNTTSLIDVSPYKHAGAGGTGAPDWVYVAPLPDDYRGEFRRTDPEAGAKYARQVAEIISGLQARGRSPAAFIAETCPSVGGQLILPTGYLANVYAAVRAAGGVCIADEVQTGLGRMGTSFWAFEDQHVVPDIVVMGKPLGNGHPIGAVATTRAIANAFDNGMEFFSTFGGNTVSCAVGTAVLDVLRDERLQAHARDVGDYLSSLLCSLKERHAIVGDVRGSGLFLGVELVRDRSTLEPAGAEASFVANRMRERGVLLGTDGPHHNVVKIRPPMPFDRADADLLVDALDRSLAELNI